MTNKQEVVARNVHYHSRRQVPLPPAPRSPADQGPQHCGCRDCSGNLQPRRAGIRGNQEVCHFEYLSWLWDLRWRDRSHRASLLHPDGTTAGMGQDVEASRKKCGD